MNRKIGAELLRTTKHTVKKGGKRKSSSQLLSERPHPKKPKMVLLLGVEEGKHIVD